LKKRSPISISIRNISIAAIFIAYFLAFFFGFLLIRSISQALAMPVRFCGKIAAADLSSQITITSQDEVGKLLESGCAPCRAP